MKEIGYEKLCIENAALLLRESRRNGTLSIVKAKCTWVVCKEVDKTVNDDISRVCEGII